MRYVPVLTCALITLFSISNASANVFTGNKVRLADDDVAPARSVGVIYKPDEKLCIGTLIARDLILTTASCFFDDWTGIQSRGKFLFGIGGSILRRTNNTLTEITEVRLGSTQHGPFRPPGGKNAPFNWAIARIADPLGDKFGWLEICVEPWYYNVTKNCIGWPPKFQLYGMISFTLDPSRGLYRTIEKNCGFKAYDEEFDAFGHNCSGKIEGAPLVVFPNPKDHRRARILGIFSYEIGPTRDTVPYSMSTTNIMTPANQFYNDYLDMLHRSRN